MSSVTATRSSATPLAITRAPFGNTTIPSAAARAGSAGAVNAVTNNAYHRSDGDQRGNSGNDHQPAHARDHAGRHGVGLGGWGRTGAGFGPFALRFVGG